MCVHVCVLLAGHTHFTCVHFTPHVLRPRSHGPLANLCVPAFCVRERLWLWRVLLEVPPEVSPSRPGQMSYSPPFYILSSTENRTEHPLSKCHPSPSPLAVFRFNSHSGTSLSPHSFSDFTHKARNGPEWLFLSCKGSESTLTMAKEGSHGACPHHSLLNSLRREGLRTQILLCRGFPELLSQELPSH